jgi:hypothetical protein
LFSGAHAFKSRAQISTTNTVQIIILEKFKQGSQTITECLIRKANHLCTLDIYLIYNYKSMEYYTLSFKTVKTNLFTYLHLHVYSIYIFAYILHIYLHIYVFLEMHF